MSGYAYMWAKRQRVGDSSVKTLLKTYAHWAAEDYSTWVTNDELECDTELNIQTIRKARARLIEMGYLVETPRRVGDTRSIVVYQMLAPAGSTVVQAIDRCGEAVSLSPPTAEAYRKQSEKQSPSKSRRTKGNENSSPSKSGRAEGDENSNPSKSEAPPDPARSPSKSHVKGDEISPEGGGNLEGNKAVEEQEKNGEKKCARPAPRIALHGELRSIELPDWLPDDAWIDWCEHREAKANGKNSIPWTRPAARVSLKKLEKIHDRGFDVADAIDESVLRGWSGIWEAKGEPDSGNATTATPADWHKSTRGITERGRQLGVEQASGEVFMRFKARVVKRAGPGEWMEEMLADAARFGDEHYESLYRYFNDIPRDAVVDGEDA